jgi:ActR/RegA family two-component response regulator
MTGYASTGSAVEALRLGVVDYLEKPSPELDLIGSRIQRAIRIQSVREQQTALAQRVSELEQERRQTESANAQLRIELGVMAELVNPQAQDAIEALRREIEQREMMLLQGAEKIVASLRSLQSELKPGAQGSLTRLLAEADAHLALLRRAS